MHPNSHWSGVYYVHAPEGAGDIEFTDPRTDGAINLSMTQKKLDGSQISGLSINFRRFGSLM